MEILGIPIGDVASCVTIIAWIWTVFGLYIGNKNSCTQLRISAVQKAEEDFKTKIMNADYRNERLGITTEMTADKLYQEFCSSQYSNSSYKCEIDCLLESGKKLFSKKPKQDGSIYAYILPCLHEKYPQETFPEASQWNEMFQRYKKNSK